MKAARQDYKIPADSGAGFSGPSGLMDYAGLAARWGVSVRQAKRKVIDLRVRVVDLGHRTKRFRPIDILRAEARAAGERGLV